MSTDAYGTYSLRVAPSDYTVSASATGYKDQSQSGILVEANESEVVDLLLEQVPVTSTTTEPSVVEEPAVVSGKPIVVDGLKEDWQTFSPLVTDLPGDAVKGNVDIKALHGFTDAESLYLMVEFNETDTYHHIDVNIDIDGDKETDYVCSIIPGQEDFVFREGKETMGGENFSVLTGIDCKEEEVVEVQIPLSLFENRTEYAVKVAFFQETDTGGYYIDETDWAHVTSFGDQAEEEPTATTPTPSTQTPTPTGGGLSCACSPNTQSSAIGDISLLLGIMVVCFGVRQFRKK